VRAGALGALLRDGPALLCVAIAVEKALDQPR
jgi:hypothetical protein